MLRLMDLPPCVDVYDGREKINRYLHEHNMVDDFDEILQLALDYVSSEGESSEKSLKSDEAFWVPRGTVI